VAQAGEPRLVAIARRLAARRGGSRPIPTMPVGLPESREIPFPACSRPARQESEQPLAPEQFHSDATAVRAAAGRCGLCGHVPGLQPSAPQALRPQQPQPRSHVVGLGSSMSIPIPGNGWTFPSTSGWGTCGSSTTARDPGRHGRGAALRASGSIKYGRYRGAAPGTADRPSRLDLLPVEEARVTSSE